MQNWKLAAILLICIALPSKAQILLKDSLLSIIKKGDSQSTVDALNKLSDIYIETNAGKDYAVKALALSEKIKYKYGRTNSLINLGEVCIKKDKHDSASVYFREAYLTAEEDGNVFNMGNALFREAFAYNSLKQFDKSLDYNYRAYKLFLKVENPYWAAKAIRNIGLIYKYQGRNEEAIKSFEICLDLRRRAKDQKDIASSLQDIGTIYYRSGDYDRAVKYYLEAIEINENLSYDLGLAGGYGNIANIYVVLNKKEEALKYYKKALELAVKINNKRIEATVLAAIGQLYLSEGKYAEAAKQFEVGIDLKKSIKDNTQLPDMLCEYALAISKLGDINKALRIYGEAEKLSNDLQDQRGKALVFAGLSKIYFDRSDFNKSKQYAQKGYNLAKRIKLKAEMVQMAEVLHRSFAKVNDFEKAYFYQKIYHDYSDSLLNEKKVGEITKLQSKYYYEKKIMEEEKKRQRVTLIEEKKIQRYKFYVLIIFSWFLMLAIGAFFYNKKLNKKNKIIVEQNRELGKLLAELKETQKQLIQKEKMASIGILTAGIAHEINNPVNYIMSAAYSYDNFIQEVERAINSLDQIIKLSDIKSFKKAINILQKEYDKERVIGNLKIVNDSIKEGISRINRLVGALRNFSRSDDERKSQINLHEQIDSCLLLMKHRIFENINIKKEYDSLYSDINCYQSLLSQVFTNILNNAIDAMEFGGDIIIKTKFIEEGNKVEIKIKDSGIGIDNNVKDKIFDPFFTTKEVGKGVGLGLSISFDIIQKHKGNIQISNCNPGTEVIIVLPVT